MRRIVMRLPDEAREEFIFMSPFTPRQKDNLAAWMVARNDGEHYGQLLVYRFPKQSLVFGPAQVVNRMNQDTEIARQISLWDQRGSQVIRGNLLVIPIEESLIYIRPLYLRAANGKFPALTRVIVAYENQFVMEPTLDEALDRLFPGGGARRTAAPAASAEPIEPGEAPPSDLAALAAQARAHYERALQAQRDGNWALYGEEIKKLGEVLQKMKTAK